MTEDGKKILEQIKADSAMEAYCLTIRRDATPGLLDSKFGGLAYWDSSLPYPTDPRGVPMQLLAQINFGQFQAEAPLPRRGLLQFFIARDDVFGADFHHPEEQKGFRAVYRPEIDPRITSEQAAALERAAFPPGAEGDEEQAYCSPVCKEAAVLIQKKIAYMGPCDCRFEQTFRRAVQKALGVKMPEKQSHYAFLCKEDRDELWKELSNAGHWLLGYPYFTQDDPRQPEGPFDTLLFQMDSDMEGALDYVLWGDCGVGNFFINRKDLENLDFSRVLYSWDCCCGIWKGFLEAYQGDKSLPEQEAALRTLTQEWNLKPMKAPFAYVKGISDQKPLNLESKNGKALYKIKGKADRNGLSFPFYTV